MTEAPRISDIEEGSGIALKLLKVALTAAPFPLLARFQLITLERFQVARLPPTDASKAFVTVFDCPTTKSDQLKLATITCAAEFSRVIEKEPAGIDEFRIAVTSACNPELFVTTVGRRFVRSKGPVPSLNKLPTTWVPVQVRVEGDQLRASTPMAELKSVSKTEE